MMAIQDVVKLLIDKGADVNAKNNNGSTALTRAKEFYSETKEVRAGLVIASPIFFLLM